MENTGMLIRIERKKLGIKIYELAQRVGINPVYITQIEKHNKLPSISVFLGIEKHLNLPMSIRMMYFKEKYPDLLKVMVPFASNSM